LGPREWDTAQALGPGLPYPHDAIAMVEVIDYCSKFKSFSGCFPKNSQGFEAERRIEYPDDFIRHVYIEATIDTIVDE
jgi:hypothetical protein